ncbi:MAG: hypothetical protein ABFD25_01860 [Clostridiaceae bacterium]
MYFVGLIAFLFFLVCSALISTTLSHFIDMPSIVIILAFSISMLMASGLFPDFLRGFKIIGEKVNTWSIIELKKTEIALELMIKLLLLSGLLGSLIGLVSILANLNDLSKLGPCIGVSALSFLYSVVIVFILLPVKAKVNAIIQTME